MAVILSFVLSFELKQSRDLPRLSDCEFFDIHFISFVCPLAEYQGEIVRPHGGVIHRGACGYYHDRDRDPDRDHDRDPDRDHDHDPDPDRDPDHDHDHDRDPDRDRDHDPNHDRDPDPDHDRDRDHPANARAAFTFV
jgi:hypothetical protein